MKESRNIERLILLVCAAVLLFAISVPGTLCYLLTGTQPVTNHFEPAPLFELKYDANGGSGAPADQYQYSTAGSVTFTIPSGEPTRAGYNFLGWAESNTATTAGYHPGVQITLNGVSGDSKTLYAVWKASSVTLTFKPGDNGYAKVEEEQYRTINCKKGENYYIYDNTAYGIYPKPGYVFSGWSYTNEYGEIQYILNQWIYTINENMTFTAVWSQVTPETNATISYYPNFSEGSSGVRVYSNQDSGKIIHNPSEHLQDITTLDSPGVGYVFGGWYRDAACREPVQYPYIVKSGDNNFYASWVEPGNAHPEYSHGDYYVLFDSGRGNESWGWPTKPWTSGENDLVSYKDEPAPGMLLLYAKKDIEVREFDTNYGHGSGATGPLFNGRSGYTVGGLYYLDRNGERVDFSENSDITTKISELTYNHTIYIDWIPVTYTIQFDGNGSESGSMPPQEFSSGIQQQLSPNEFVREGYRFVGWCTKPQPDASSYLYDDAEAVTIEGDQILYAQWKQIDSPMMAAPRMLKGLQLDVQELMSGEASEKLDVAIGDKTYSVPGENNMTYSEGTLFIPDEMLTDDVKVKTDSGMQIEIDVDAGGDSE